MNFWDVRTLQLETCKADVSKRFCFGNGTDRITIDRFPLLDLENNLVVRVRWNEDGRGTNHLRILAVVECQAERVDGVRILQVCRRLQLL
jgi:hypothetical protein